MTCSDQSIPLTSSLITPIRNYLRGITWDSYGVLNLGTSYLTSLLPWAKDANEAVKICTNERSRAVFGSSAISPLCFWSDVPSSSKLEPSFVVPSTYFLPFLSSALSSSNSFDFSSFIVSSGKNPQNKTKQTFELRIHVQVDRSMNLTLYQILSLGEPSGNIQSPKESSAARRLDWVNAQQ